MKEKIQRILPLLGVILGFLLAFYPWLSEYLFEHHAETTIKTYGDIVSEQIDDSNKEKMLKDAEDYNSTLSKALVVIKDPMKYASTDLSSDYENILCVNDDGLMCTIEIPKIKVLLPVFHGTEENTLRKGIGHLMGTSIPVGGQSTHSVLSGHTGLNSAKMFTDLTALKKDDLFYIHVLDKTLAYKVVDINVVEPSDTELLHIQKGRDLCTLVTCTPYGVNSHRLLVTGERTEYVQSDHEQEVIKSGDNTDSEWMNQYKKAVIIGLITTFIIFLIFIIIRLIRAKHNKKTAYSSATIDLDNTPKISLAAIQPDWKGDKHCD